MSEQNPTAAERREAAAEAKEQQHQTAAERRETAADAKAEQPQTAAERREAAAEHKTTSVTGERKEAKVSTSGTLGKAGESGDPEVQKALADLQTAQTNRGTLDVNRADVEAADQAVRIAQERLAELGYE